MSHEYDPAALLEQAMSGNLSLDGEQTMAAPNNGTQITTTDTTAQDAAAVDAGKTADATPADGGEQPGAPIASKSGTYTIPYEKLVEARNKAEAFKSENDVLKAKLEELNRQQQVNLENAQVQAQARAEAGKGPNQADQNLQAAQDALTQGVDPAIFGDFSEAGIAKGIQSLMAQAVPVIREQLKAELEKEIAPLKAERAKAATDSHMGAIYAKHADADEVAESAEFKSWMQSLPTFARAGVESAMAKGTTEQVIEVFDSFKARAGGNQPSPTTQANAPEVQRRVPASLSEVNGTPPVDIAQQALQMANNPAALLDRMASMTPAQLDAVMNRV
jgi:hypothetical protein